MAAVALIVLGLVVVALLVVHEAEKRRWDRERANLLQRIQAPEQAVIQHAVMAAPEEPVAVSPFSDTEYWDARREAR